MAENTKAIARDGDSEETDNLEKDTMDDTTAPPPDSYDEEKEVWYYSKAPTKDVKKVEPATGKGSETVFCNGKGVLFVGCEFNSRKVATYKRTFEIDDEGQLTGTYTDEETGSTETEVKSEEGSSKVFVEGSPIIRKGDKISSSKVKEGSEDSFAG